MAYCKRCGAYIPDGLSACLACGFDENSESAAAQSYEREQHEDLREQYEQERKKQQETSRKWAEQEYERRRTARMRNEEDLFQRNEQRRQTAREETKEQAKYYAGQVRDGLGRVARSNNKLVAALSYLSLLFLLPRFLCPEDEFARYHGRQGLTLFIFGVICDVISAMFPIGWLLSLFRLYCIYKGMSNALNGRMEPLPYIGKYGEKSD